MEAAESPDGTARLTVCPPPPTPLPQLDDLRSAVPCAYTYLQRNPEDLEMVGLMEEYKSRYDLSGHLTDHEQGAHEVS